MKKSTRIAVALLALILVAALLVISVPIPLLSMLSVPEGENWVCEVVRDPAEESVRIELDANRTEVLVRRMEHIKVRFGGLADGHFVTGWVYLHHVDAESGERLDTFRLHVNGTGDLWVDDLNFVLVGEDGAAFREALEEAIAAP